MNSFPRFIASVAAAILLVGVEAQPPSESVQVGQEVCTYGYVMDRFCIDRGTLLDASSVTTLENPEEHSVHCLVDVGLCYETPFHILEDPSSPGELYGTGWSVTSNELLMTVGRQVGSCSTCDGTGSLQKGFRAEVNGTVVTVDPPVIEVTSIDYLAEGTSGCVHLTAAVTADAPTNGGTTAEFPTEDGGTTELGGTEQDAEGAGSPANDAENGLESGSGSLGLARLGVTGGAMAMMMWLFL